ncbi:MAG: TonB-dependent receptor [Opitutaceae bacterium]|nr:TonB-dependent receptor [Opitutaceae bacterium]
MRFVSPLLLATIALTSHGQISVEMTEMVIHSPRIANQAPVATFAMPVSALRYEALVDVQGRNMAEGQADVSIRGGTFENTGFRIGSVTILDPQTGHYFAEIPVPPAMLGALDILTGAANSFGSINVNVGTIAYGWQPIVTRGQFSLGVGEDNLNRQELYQGYARELSGGAFFGVDVEYSRSSSDGSIPQGDHDFERVGGRLQWRTDRAQTDLFIGYQAKFFGWPNLYTPYGVDETENLQTVLVTLNHRAEREAGGYFEAGAYYRRNRDDYEFNRHIPGQYNPYQHTTWLHGAAISGREVRGDWAVVYRGEVASDKIESTSLTSGSYNTRQMLKLALAGEHQWATDDGGAWVALGGMTLDDTNRDSGAVSPVVNFTRRFATSSATQSIALSYVEATQVPSYTAVNSSAAGGLFRGNATLGRETSRNVELGLTGNYVGWQTEAAIFYRQDDDLVDWTFSNGVTARFANAVDIATTGFEIIGRRDFDWGGVTLGYTYMDKDADYGSTTIDASFYALNFAKHRVTAAITTRISEEWELRFDNEARLQEENPLRSAGGEEALTSALSIVWHPKMWRGIEFSISADNLWDSDFQEVPSVPAARRQVALSVAYGW